MSAPEVHKQYDEGVSAFRRLIGDPGLRAAFAAEADGFFRRGAVGVWGEDGGLSPQHVEYYNAIYCKGAPVPSVLYWDLCAQVADYPGFQPPRFFAGLIEYDKRTGKKLARRFVDTFTLMLLLFAAVDNIVSEAEAAFVNRCANALTQMCDAAALPADKAVLDVGQFVTPGHETGREPAPVEAPAAPEEEPGVDQLLAQLDELCGLEKVKADVKSLINLAKVRKLREKEGLPVPPLSLHLVFMGNPGTGKTTVARLLAKIYHAIGVLSKGQLVEVDRSGLVAGFVGQTAIKTREAIEKALGGVLFIDEAYALTSSEAIETLLKGMEDHRDDLVVIVAGYTDLMDEFIHANPGLESRFNKYFVFEDYTGEQLFAIFQSLCQKNGYALDPQAEEFCRKSFAALYENRDENFGNGRDVRNLFEQAVARQADRLAALESPTKDQLMALTVENVKDPAAGG